MRAMSNVHAGRRFHFVAIGKLEWHVRTASHCGSKQQ